MVITGLPKEKSLEGEAAVYVEDESFLAKRLSQLS